jgi:starch-binding outer membrane protein, SusD/RagB family
MNIKISITAISFLTLSLFACKKLEIKPEGLVDPADAIKNERDVKANLNGCYTVLRDGSFWGGSVAIKSELMADATSGASLTGEDLSLFNFSNNGNFNGGKGLIEKPYTVIQRANITLSNLDLITSSAEEKENAEGQARFVKALSYFEMVKLYAQPWGFTTDNSHLGLVLKNSGDLETGLPRATVKEVYEEIISDLKKAETLLPSVNGNYPTNYAAKALLARVYFQMNDFENAYTYADGVIESGEFVFDTSAAFAANRFSNPVTPEAIFWIINEPGLAASFGGLRNDANLNLSMNLPITFDTYLTGTSNTNDRRSAWYNVVTAGSVYGIKKYSKPDFVLPVIHITEMKLIRAEAAAELNQHLDVAVQDFNDIVLRAYGGTYTPLPGTASAALIKEQVRGQRKLEMIYESGDRLQQIKRIGANGEPSFSRTAPWNCPGMVLQFPSQEVNANKNFIQNPTGICL